MPDPELQNEDLIAFLLRDSDGPTSEQLEAALQQDPEIGSRLAILRSMLKDLRDANELETLFRVDASRLSRVARASAPSRSRLRSRLGELREVIAELVLLPQTSPRPAFRSGLVHGGLRYSGGDIEIDIRASRSRAAVEGLYGGEVEVIGRVVSSHDTSMRAREVRLIGNEQALSGVVDSDGFFEVWVRPGLYRLEVLFDDRMVIAEPVDLTGVE